jgi:protein-S-isoprenylcysteine O-methyltransferase Ste14
VTFSEQGGWWVVAQFAWFGVILAAAWTLGPSQVSGPEVTVGTVLVAGGVVLGLAGAVPLGTRLSPFPAPAEGARLRTRGVFATARHPIYGGVILFFAGVAIRSGSWPAIVAALALVPFFWAKSGHEERLLAERFPEYADYRQRVRPRFIPWLL